MAKDLFVMFLGYSLIITAFVLFITIANGELIPAIAVIPPLGIGLMVLIRAIRA